MSCSIDYSTMSAQLEEEFGSGSGRVRLCYDGMVVPSFE